MSRFVEDRTAGFKEVGVGSGSFDVTVDFEPQYLKADFRDINHLKSSDSVKLGGVVDNGDGTYTWTLNYQVASSRTIRWLASRPYINGLIY
jgi:hypothetical protein